VKTRVNVWIFELHAMASARNLYANKSDQRFRVEIKSGVYPRSWFQDL
jgi:hypothetical protein